MAVIKTKASGEAQPSIISDPAVSVKKSYVINRTIPANFLGITAQYWPIGPTAQNPNVLPYKWTRSITAKVVDGTGTYELQWRNLHWKAASISWSGTTVTVELDITYQASYLFSTGDKVVIAGSSSPGINSAGGAAHYTITKINSTSFTYTGTTSGTGSASTGSIFSVFYISKFDDWVNTHKANNTDIAYTLFGTPQFAALNPFEANPGWPGYLGGVSPHTDIGAGAIQAFVAMLWQRYFGKIQFIEVWNEPQYGAGGAVEGNYYTGTPTNLSDMCRIVKQTLLTNSATMQVISPPPASASKLGTIQQILSANFGNYGPIGTYQAKSQQVTSAPTTASTVLNFTTTQNLHATTSVGLHVFGAGIPDGTTLVSFVSNTSITVSVPVTVGASVTVSVGGGIDYVDIIGVHSYHTHFTGDIFDQIIAIKNWLTAVGESSLPIYSTECGYLDAYTGIKTDKEWLDNVAYILRSSVLAGCDKVMLYAWDDLVLKVNDRPAVNAALASVINAITGKTYTSVQVDAQNKKLTVI